MTNLEITLTAILWVTIGLFLGKKWEYTDKTKTMFLFIPSILFAPIVLLIAIIRQTFIEDWR